MRQVLRVTCLLILSLVASRADAKMRWSFHPGLGSAGDDGIVIGDFDGDGTREAAFSGGAFGTASGQTSVVIGLIEAHGYTDALRTRGGIIERYRLSSPLVTGRVGGKDHLFTQLPLFDGSGGYEILELAGVPLKVVRRIPCEWPVQLRAIVDLDADGDIELIGLQRPYEGYSSGLIVSIDYATGLSQVIEPIEARQVTVAALDADAALELIVSRDTGVVLDGDTMVQDWSYPAGFGSFVVAGRFSPEPHRIGFVSLDLSVSPDSRATVFQAQPFSPLRNIALRSNLATDVIASDVDGDGIDEVIVASGNWASEVTAYNPLDATYRAYPTGEFDTTALGAGALGHFNSTMLVLAKGPYGSLVGQLRVVDAASEALRFQANGATGPYSGVLVDDLDDDGNPDVLFPLSAQQDDGRWRSFCRLDAGTGKLQRCHEGLDTQMVWPGDHAPIAGQFDVDPAQELAVLDGSEIVLLDSASLLQLQRLRLPETIASDVVAMAGVLFNEDAITDIAIATLDSTIHVVDGRSGAQLWQSVSLGSIYGGYRALLEVVNVDDDARPELLLTSPEAIYAFDTATGLLQWSIETDRVPHLLTVWGEGADCRIAIYDGGLPDMLLYRCDTQALAGKRALPHDTRVIRALSPEGDHLLIAAGGRLQTLDADGVRYWSGYLGADLGAGNNADVRFLSHGRFDVIVGSEVLVSRIRVDFDLLFEDAFE